ncbi:MAG TPA: amidophosphoribosyltransferase [Candidatus Eisenbacteria bacterium]
MSFTPRDRDDDRFHDACGVFGAVGVDAAAHAVYLGLYSLQHRGQESTGIVAADGGEFQLHKAMGLVADVFDNVRLDSLKGRMAIGHNRYSTAGDSTLRNAQPILVTYHGGHLAVAHNGNIVNAIDLKKEMEGGGHIFQTTSDSEVILHLIARSPARSFEEALGPALSRLSGAFSLVLMTDTALYAVRDPLGFRPLSIARLRDGWVVASETCAFDINEAEYVRDVEPGEVVRIDESGPTTILRLPSKRQASCIFELIYFARPDSTVFGESVNRVRRELGRKLAEEHPADADIVIAVPDSSNAAALGYAEKSGLPFEFGLIRNHYIGRTFISPRQFTRDHGVRVKFNPVKGVLDGKRVVVVDDSIVRGTTSRKLVKLIRRAGAKEVHFRISSPPIVSPCFFGIDTPRRAELIGANHTVEEIGTYLRVDSIGYLSQAGMLSVVKNAAGHCTACFDENYPVPLAGLPTDRALEPVGR